ncbi:hypothetical protein, partial [Salmonella enterica]|uniref:hypothetical protein n=1 Tax=Salmonella enterica TaxID=28901 RepID=UPI001C46F68F
QILLPETNLLHRCCVGCIRKVSHILQYAPSFPSFAALPQRKILSFPIICNQAENLLKSAKTASAL